MSGRHIGDCREVMRRLIADGVKVQMCVTSPPYWGLRDYGTAQWEGGDDDCDHAQLRNIGASTLRNDGRERIGTQAYEKTAATIVPYRDVCGKCGAKRIDRQLGLESTPQEYVANIVEVFRLVRDLLAEDGTLWLNLGDCYATGAGAVGEHPGGGVQGERWKGYRGDRNGSEGKHDYLAKAIGPVTQPNRMPQAGLKPKDLVGIPWRVAFALQQPYYSGRIKNVEDRIWLASMIDGEGCMFIHKRKAGTDSGARFTKADGTIVSYDRTADTYGAGLEVANTHLAIVERCQQITGVGSICRQDKDRKQPLYRWNCRSNECRWVIQEIYPHLVAKQRQARLLLGGPSSGERAEAAHRGLILLHNGGLTDVDFPAPESMFKPGYYLRQDIIWSKKNPMPESVRDRCTKSHEYIFLLAKSERYYYDADAIAEPADISNWRESPCGRDAPGQTPDSGFQKPGGRTGFTTRNRRSVWTVTTKPFSGAHFATFPPDLIEPCILAGRRPGDTVLDPFFGSGTVGEVCNNLGRQWIGCELNPEYAKLQERRTAQQGMVLT